MGRPAECADLIKRGKTPAEIASYFKLNVRSVIQYLYVAVGFKLISFKDIVVAIPRQTRDAIELIVGDLGTDYWFDVWREAQARHVDIYKSDLTIYLSLRSIYVGDLFYLLRELERSLHALIRKTLVKAHGAEGDAWWARGVPAKVVKRCADMWSNDRGGRDHPYSYTTFIQLIEILRENWGLFFEHLPDAAARDRDGLLRSLDKANDIRKWVMHPVWGDFVPPDEDLANLVSLRSLLEPSKWRFS